MATFQTAPAAQQLLGVELARQETVSEYLTGSDEEQQAKQRLPLLTWPLCRFPQRVNAVAARMIGLQAFSFAVVAVLFREQPWAGWMMLALACDFALRFLFGGLAAPVGLLAALLAKPFEPRPCNGSPKQFATSLGVLFSGATAALLLTGHRGAGAVVAGMLAGAAGLEAFFDFCAGCVMFRYAVQFGLFASKVPCAQCQAQSPKAVMDSRPKRSTVYETESEDDREETVSTTASSV